MTLNIIMSADCTLTVLISQHVSSNYYHASNSFLKSKININVVAHEQNHSRLCDWEGSFDDNG